MHNLVKSEHTGNICKVLYDQCTTELGEKILFRAKVFAIINGFQEKSNEFAHDTDVAMPLGTVLLKMLIF